MRSFRLILIPLVLLTAPAFGQKTWKPWIVADGGPVWGGYEATGDVRLQGGMKINGWLIGAGASYDPYRFHTLPIYVQGRKMFGNGKSKPFILGSLGANIILEEDQNGTNVITPFVAPWSQPNYQYTNGIYAEGGIGWAFRTTKKWGFNLSFSYTHKTNTEKYESRMWAGNNETETTTSENKYLMNRLSIRIGVSL